MTDHNDGIDPRAQLGSSGAPRVAGSNVEPQYFEFTHMEPTTVTPEGGRQWWVRSQALVIGFADLAADERLAVDGHPDEYMVIVVAPVGHVGRPRCADVMDVVAGQLQADLFEVVVMMR